VATAPLAAEVVGKQITVDGGGFYTDVSVAELQTMLANKDFTFINVHIPFEGNIANTDLSIPYDQVAQNLDKLPDKDAKIVLYCRSDRMSNIAAKELVSLGYTNVWNLDGGMVAWEAAGLPIER
jgi:rhodanese-related sulfurtransferase